MKKKVMIGMSGGVDSSVAAAILIKQGYEVVGVTMKIWTDIGEEQKNTEGGCCSLYAVDDARRVADKLGIPYYVMNFQNIFNEKVINYFIEEYVKGHTPNPCIACNRYVKFEELLDKAIAMEMDYISTGHYAKVEYDTIKNRYLLKKSAAIKKDQTYALYNLTQKQLKHTLMPIGDYTKEQVREIAIELGLAVASKPDSQEICFVEDNNYGRFITSHSNKEIKSGNFIDADGRVLGTHKGIINYTIGQRKGLGIAFGKPMYVVGLDIENNTVVLGDEIDVFKSTLTAYDLNFVSIDKLEAPMLVKAKIRYSAPEAEAVIYPETQDRVRVEFLTPQRAITPGQSVVFYDGDNVLGGGVIC